MFWLRHVYSNQFNLFSCGRRIPIYFSNIFGWILTQLYSFWILFDRLRHIGCLNGQIGKSNQINKKHQFFSLSYGPNFGYPRSMKILLSIFVIPRSNSCYQIIIWVVVPFNLNICSNFSRRLGRCRKSGKWWWKTARTKNFCCSDCRMEASYCTAVILQRQLENCPATFPVRLIPLPGQEAMTSLLDFPMDRLPGGHSQKQIVSSEYFNYYK